MSPIALTIAGSDSSGGAGLQADLKTFSALGVYGCSVVAALTAQNTLGVSAVEDVSPDFILAQMDAVYSDLNVLATKIGMLSCVETIEAVAKGLKQHHAKKIILDPVMVSATGARLLQEDAIAHLVQYLFPLADLVTPNLHEASVLLGQDIALSDEQQKQQAKAIAKLGAKAVLVKGGHSKSNNCVDWLFWEDEFFAFSHEKFPTQNTHGTGCTLSSAITARLAKGDTLKEAVGFAKDYISGAIANADQLDIGKGCGPVHHFYKVW